MIFHESLPQNLGPFFRFLLGGWRRRSCEDQELPGSYFKALDAHLKHLKLQSHLGYQQKSSQHSFFVLVNPNHPAIGSFHFEVRDGTQAIGPPKQRLETDIFLGGCH